MILLSLLFYIKLYFSIHLIFQGIDDCQAVLWLHLANPDQLIPRTPQIHFLLNSLQLCVESYKFYSFLFVDKWHLSKPVVATFNALHEKHVPNCRCISAIQTGFRWCQRTNKGIMVRFVQQCDEFRESQCFWYAWEGKKVMHMLDGCTYAVLTQFTLPLM